MQETSGMGVPKEQHIPQATKLVTVKDSFIKRLDNAKKKETYKARLVVRREF